MGTTGGASDGEEAQANTYATLSQLRLVSHFKTGDISDDDVNALIPDADRAILSLATIEVYDEELEGCIDGSNKIFTTEHRPIADINFNKTITKDDVTVYLADYDEEGNAVSTEAEISEVNDRDGIITLVTAPTAVNAEAGVFTDYRYYKEPVNWDRLTLAANYYLAHLCEMATPILVNRAIKMGFSGTKTRWYSLALSQLGFAKPSLIGGEK